MPTRQTKTILSSVIIAFAISLFAYAEPASMGQGNSGASQKIINKLISTLTIKKMSGTIKWSKGEVSKSVTIATTPTTETDLSFLDSEGLYLDSILRFVETDWRWNAVNLVKINKKKTVVKFLLKSEWEKHLVIMKLKKGVFTVIIKNNGGTYLVTRCLA